MKKFNVLIVGAGKIGAFYDNPHSNQILTHAHAFTKHKGYNFLGFVEVNKQKAKEAVLRWGGRSFVSLKQAFEENKIDIVCVATPDEHHYKALKKIASFPVKLVFAEKPLTKTLKEANSVVSIYKKNKISVVVNYSRRFVPEFNKIQENIENGIYGSFITGTGYYGKGLIHNGSHLIDLLRWFLGEVKNFNVINSAYDFYKDDPSVAAVLTFNKDKPFFLQYIDCKLFSIFEIDLFFKKRRILIKEAGKIVEYRIKKHPIFKDYKTMVKVKEMNTMTLNSIYYAVDNIYEFLTKGVDLKCNLEESYKTLKSCTDISAHI